MKVGILVHGLFLQANDWENIVWGQSPQQLGCLPKAVQVALSFGLENVARIVFGTGASKQDGLKEGEYTRRELSINMRRLEDYPVLAGFHEFKSTLGLNRLNRLIGEATLELDAQNTFEEIANAAQHFANAGCTMVIQIPTCGSHASRCTKTFIQVMERGLIPEDQLWLLSPLDTTFAGSVIDDVAIAEPPHRADDPMLTAPVKVHEVIPRIFRLPVEVRKAFLVETAERLSEKGV